MIRIMLQSKIVVLMMKNLRNVKDEKCVSKLEFSQD